MAKILFTKSKLMLNLALPCAFDDLHSITEQVRKLENETGLKIWIYVDAAYGGPVCLVMQYFSTKRER